MILPVVMMVITKKSTRAILVIHGPMLALTTQMMKPYSLLFYQQLEARLLSAHYVAGFATLAAGNDYLWLSSLAFPTNMAPSQTLHHLPEVMIGLKYALEPLTHVLI